MLGEIGESKNSSTIPNWYPFGILPKRIGDSIGSLFASGCNLNAYLNSTPGPVLRERLIPSTWILPKLLNFCFRRICMSLGSLI